MSKISVVNNSSIIKKDSATFEENSIQIFRWLSAITLPLIVMFIVYFFFRYAYNFFFWNMDRTFILGSILWVPVTTLLTILSFYALLPKFKFGITLATCVTIFILNTVSTIENLIYWTGFNLGSAVQNILSNIIIFLITIYLPVYLYKRMNNK